MRAACARRAATQRLRGVARAQCTDTGFVERELARFNTELVVEEASTPPSSWYTDERILQRERSTVHSAVP